MKLDKPAAEKAYKVVYDSKYEWDDDADTANDPLTRIVLAPSVADAKLAVERAIAENRWSRLGRDDADRLRGEYLKLVPPYVDGVARVEVDGWSVWARADEPLWVNILQAGGNPEESNQIEPDGGLNAYDRLPLKVLRAAYDLWERTGGVA